MAFLAALSKDSEKNFCADVNFVLYSLIQSTEVTVVVVVLNQVHNNVDSL